MNLDDLKKGDLLEYIGPPRIVDYTGSQNHPTGYTDHYVIEVCEFFLGHLYPHMKQAWVGSIDSKGRPCCGSKLLNPQQWRIITN
jgi:hypothetical protein